MNGAPPHVRVDGRYLPLVQLASLAAGAGLLTAMLAGSALVGALVCCVVLAVGAGWRIGEPLVVPAWIAYEWVFIATPIVFLALKGRTPFGNRVGDIQTAAVLSMIAWLCLMIGFRLGNQWAGTTPALSRLHTGGRETRYRVPLLAVMSMVLYLPDFFFDVRPRLTGGLSQVILTAQGLRDVLLLALWYVVLRRGSGYGWGIAALAVAIMPRFASVQSSFKEFLFMILIALLSQWRPLGTMDAATRRRSRRFLVATIVGVVAMFVFGVVWEVGIKPIWRTAGVGGSPLEKLAVVSTIARGATQRVGLDLSYSIERTAARLSSGGFFGLVLARVPTVVPHAHGQLLWGAIEHVTHPRFLFPDKPDLGTGSEIANLYAGLDVREGTSVSIGYLGEFYVDFGIPGMFVPVLALGVLIGLLYGGCARLAPSLAFFEASVTVLFTRNLFGLGEGNFTKSLGGLVMSAAVFALFLAALVPRLHRFLAGPAAMTDRARVPLSVRQAPLPHGR